MSIRTLEEIESMFDVRVLEHLDRTVAIPTITRAGVQGDVSILRVTTAAATTAIPQIGVAVVRGENGGNTHSLHGVGFWDVATGGDSGSLTLGTLTVPEEGEVFLLHPEHGGMTMTPGTYRIGRQREWSGEWRAVAD